jgi:hypothetical protein
MRRQGPVGDSNEARESADGGLWRTQIHFVTRPTLVQKIDPKCICFRDTVLRRLTPSDSV